MNCGFSSLFFFFFSLTRINPSLWELKKFMAMSDVAGRVFCTNKRELLFYKNLYHISLLFQFLRGKPPQNFQIGVPMEKPRVCVLCVCAHNLAKIYRKCFDFRTGSGDQFMKSMSELVPAKILRIK